MTRTHDTTYLHNRKHTFANSDTCWICGQYVDPNVKWPSPWFKTADHIIPVAQGGNNHGPLAVAHLACNRARGAARGKTIRPSRHGRQW